MNIVLSDQVATKSIKTTYDIEDYDFVTTSIGNDHKIYLLYASKIPARIENAHGSFVQTTSNADYKAVVLTVDWDLGGILHSQRLDFGNIKPNIFFIQPIEGNYLLMGARATRFKDGTVEQNAIIVDEKGKILKNMCLGDGIQDCLVDDENNIITSYFDEGVLGNRGWGGGGSFAPLGSHGIVKWSATGEKQWEDNQYGIFDCYTMNVDDRNHLWFYYYTAFNLVHTDFSKDNVYDPKIQGASNFMLRKDYAKIIFQEGYENQGGFSVKSFEGNRLSNKEEACYFVYQQQKITDLVAVRGSKALFWDKEEMLYYVDWDNQKEGGIGCFA